MINKEELIINEVEKSSVMVPNGWNNTKISKVCKLQNGNSFKPEDWDTKQGKRI